MSTASKEIRFNGQVARRPDNPKGFVFQSDYSLKGVDPESFETPDKEIKRMFDRLVKSVEKAGFDPATIKLTFKKEG